MIIIYSKYKEAYKRAKTKYMVTRHQIRVIVPEEDFQVYKTAAERKGFTSINQFVIYCIEKGLE